MALGPILAQLTDEEEKRQRREQALRLQQVARLLNTGRGQNIALDQLAALPHATQVILLGLPSELITLSPGGSHE